MTEIDNTDFETEEYCTCNKYEYEPHGCPYAQEINDDYEHECTCCPYCTNECSQEI